MYWSNISQFAVTGYPGVDYWFSPTQPSILEQQASSVCTLYRNGVLHTPMLRFSPGDPNSLADNLLLLSRFFKWKPRFTKPEYSIVKVDPVGFEPTTFSMPLRRAPSCAMGPFSIVREILPPFISYVNLLPVDLAGFEPATSSVRLMRAPNCATGPRASEFYLMASGVSRKRPLRGSIQKHFHE